MNVNINVLLIKRRIHSKWGFLKTIKIFFKKTFEWYDSQLNPSQFGT